MRCNLTEPVQLGLEPRNRLFVPAITDFEQADRRRAEPLLALHVGLAQ